MGAALPYQQTCCAPTCSDPQIQNIPGPSGTDGLDGAPGDDGVNAFTTLTSGFLMPALEGTVTVAIADSTWMSVGQVVYVQQAGFMEVTALGNNISATLKNLETAGGAYAANVAPGTSIPAGRKISPGGWQGPTGATTGAAGGDLEGTYPNPTLEVTTTLGDLIVNNNNAIAPRNTALARGLSGTVLHSHDAEPLKVNYRALDLTGINTSLSGALPIANGGTGQAAKTAGFDALSPVTTKGDLIVRDAANNVRQAVGSNNTLLIADSTQATGLRYSKVGPENFDVDAEEVTTETVILRDIKNAGVDGDTSGPAPGTWAPRDITEISTDTTGLVTLAAHASGGVTGTKFTLPEGYYRINVCAVAYEVGYHIIRLKNVFTGSVVAHAGGAAPIYGTTEKSPTGSQTPTNSILQGRFQVIAGDQFCIEHYAQLPNVAAGYGKAATIPAVSEVYMTIMLEKIAKS